MFDFANILFSGSCNARCPFCIGKQVDPRLNVDNLDLFPLRNLDPFIDLIREHGIRQVVFTGTNTDPQLYRHEQRLLATLRSRVGRKTRFSLHTNGRLALRKMALFNQYDQACISFPSFSPFTYRAMMGVPQPPDLAEIVCKARIPVKVSCVVASRNAPEMGEFLARCRGIGVRRVVLRKLYGEKRPWEAFFVPQALGLVHKDWYCGNPVYDFAGMQVTLWDFSATQSTSINLFSSGVISRRYLLAEAVMGQSRAAAGKPSWPSAQSRR